MKFLKWLFDGQEEVSLKPSSTKSEEKKASQKGQGTRTPGEEFPDLPKTAISQLTQGLNAVIDKKEREQRLYCELVDCLTNSDKRAIEGIRACISNPKEAIVRYQPLFLQWFSEGLSVEEFLKYPLWERVTFVTYEAGFSSMNDWKDSSTDFFDGLNQVVKNYGHSLDQNKIMDESRMAPELFEQLKTTLPDHFALMNIDIDSDSYQLSVVPVEKVERIKELAQQLGGRIDWL